MLKSHVEELTITYQALFSDMARAYPMMERSFQKDLEHLTSVICSNGLHVLTVALPAAGKHFDKCLAEGKYVHTGECLTKADPHLLRVPRFLGQLYALVFDHTGVLKEGPDVTAILFIRQVYYLAKKANIMCSDELVRESVKELVDCDSALPELEKFWETTDQATADEEANTIGSFADSIYQGRVRLVGGDPLDEGDSPLHTFLVNLDRVSSLITSDLGSYDFRDWKFKHGPGAVSERAGKFNKYYFTNWPETLESEYPIADCGFGNHNLWADSYYRLRRHMTEVRRPSRLVAVPKTYLKPRLIAAEPSEHQWCQQNLWHYFRVRSSDCWIGSFIRFNDQSLNQRLALEGSKDGSLATVDLSAASDRVSCYAVGRFFRSNLRLLKCLRATRTHILSQDLDPSSPTTLRMRKFSTMGSACTFPVESLIFLGVAIAAILSHRKLRVTRESIQQLEGKLAVFGDDIIIPTDHREVVCRALEILDFKVNTDKTFGTGLFRESCGVDAFGGTDVTPVYWRSPTTADPESVLSKISTSNNFLKRGYFGVASTLRSTLPRGLKIPTVPVDSGVVGHMSYLGANLSGFSTRWNRDLQRQEALISTFETVVTRGDIRNNSAYLQFFTEDPGYLTQWKSGYLQRSYTRIVRRWVSVEALGVLNRGV